MDTRSLTHALRQTRGSITNYGRWGASDAEVKGGRTMGDGGAGVQRTQAHLW